MKYSKILGKSVYSCDDAMYHGRVVDLYIELGRGAGKVLGLYVPEFDEKASIAYSAVHSVGDIIILKA